LCCDLNYPIDDVIGWRQCNLYQPTLTQPYLFIALSFHGTTGGCSIEAIADNSFQKFIKGLISTSAASLSLTPAYVFSLTRRPPVWVTVPNTLSIIKDLRRLKRNKLEYLKKDAKLFLFYQTNKRFYLLTAQIWMWHGLIW
jgi:hypothetical protein